MIYIYILFYVSDFTVKEYTLSFKLKHKSGLLTICFNRDYPGLADWLAQSQLVYLYLLFVRNKIILFLMIMNEQYLHESNHKLKNIWMCI